LRPWQIFSVIKGTNNFMQKVNPMNQVSNDNIRKSVREQYGKIAQNEGAGCCSPGTACCSDVNLHPKGVARAMGYSENDVNTVPEGANMGLGCGNPQAIASIQPGETVLDLGSGGGFDCFLAADATGNDGQVIGVDMTPEMISKARENAQKSGRDNVEFRLGEIENLPVADASVDVIISNCVINLSPDKPRVFREAMRVLKPGGRLTISDIVATTDIPEEWQQDMDLLTGCMSGASLIGDLEDMLTQVGLVQVKIAPKDESRDFIRDWESGRGVEDYVVSATIEAIKPGV
jgi:SAM-dependent methyltransferase